MLGHMAREKFTLISERPVGRIPSSVSKRWAALVKRQAKLQAQQEKLKSAMERLEEQLSAYMSQEHITEAHEGFRLESDGTLVQLLCKCVKCQASLHAMPLSWAVESMIKANLIPKDQVATARQQAYEQQMTLDQERVNRQIFN
jgi:hypothetical protein